jgi:DNA polymerase-3 subunit delta'
MPFRDLVGHRRLLGLLTRSIAQTSLPPSLIFSGPEGIGKRRAALATAQALNCLNPVRPDSRTPDPDAPEVFAVDACGTCSSCSRIARGVHADVQTLEPGESGSIKIEQVRSAIDAAGYRPFEGRRRVFLIEEADALVEAAQHALLKTLEEPRPGSVFLLISARADVLLGTVRSRCSHLRFGRLTMADVALALMRDHGYPEREARAAAAAADGSVGRALALRAAEYAGARDMAVEVLRGASGGGRAAPPDVRARLDSVKPLTTKRSGAGGGLRTDRERVALHLQALSSLLRDVSLLATGADAHLLANLDLESGLTTLANRFDGTRAVRAFTAVDRAQQALERNVSPKIVADWLVLQI